MACCLLIFKNLEIFEGNSHSPKHFTKIVYIKSQHQLEQSWIRLIKNKKWAQCERIAGKWEKLAVIRSPWQPLNVIYMLTAWLGLQDKNTFETNLNIWVLLKKKIIKNLLDIWHKFWLWDQTELEFFNNKSSNGEVKSYLEKIWMLSVKHGGDSLMLQGQFLFQFDHF